MRAYRKVNGPQEQVSATFGWFCVLSLLKMESDNLWQQTFPLLTFGW